MSLRSALLGLLAHEPASGYDLTRRFQEGIGSFAWTAKHSQIYPELSRLADDGLVEVVAQEARGRRVYAVTDAGRQALREWLLGPPDGGTVRNEFVLRLFLLSALEPADAATMLAGVAEVCRQQVAELEAEQQALRDAGRPPSFGPYLAAQYGILTYRAALEWADWTAGQLGVALDPGR